MPLFFLVPLTTCLVTGYIFKRCTDEVGYLAALIAIVSLILSLMLAPWQIQFLLLIVVLVTTKKLLKQCDTKLKQQQNPQFPVTLSDIGSAKEARANAEFSSTTHNKIQRIPGRIDLLTNVF